MNSRTQGRTGREGSALVFALVVMIGLFGMSAAFMRLTLQSKSLIGSRLDDERAYQLAEAALSEALVALASDADGVIGSQAAPAVLGDGLLWVTSTDLGDDTRALVATALVGSGRSALRAVVDTGGEDAPLFVATLNSDEEMTLNEGVVVDSYESAVGTYASQQVNSTNGHPHALMNGHVMSNNGITLNSNASVFGNALPGPGHSVAFNNNSFVSGSTTSSPTTFEFPPIVVPSLPAALSVAVPTAGFSSLPPGDYDLDSINIAKDGTLLIEGPARIVVGDFVGGKDANLQIDASNGPVTIFCETNYTHTSGFQADAVSGSPMALAFFLQSAQDIVFPMGTPIRGAYYAPEARIMFSNDCEAWGAFAAKRIEMANTMNFHFDESLMDYWQDDTGQDSFDVVVLAWSEVRVEPASLLSDRRDPFQALGVNPAGLLSPWQAWTAQPEP